MSFFLICAAIAALFSRHPCPHPHVEQIDDWAWVCTSCDEVLEEVDP